MTNTTGKVPAIYGAFAKVLAELSVAKGGTLPSNLGGSSYIKAADLSLEVKRLFVEHGLVVFPQERFTKHEVSINNEGRKVLTIGVETAAKIVAIEDGSFEVVSGVGDAVSNGNTSVTANIASTNAMKNLLMRALLITEQSVEDASKKEEAASSGSTAAQNANPLAKAKAAAIKVNVPTKSTPAPVGEKEVIARIRANYLKDDMATSDEIKNLANEIRAKDKLSGAALYTAVEKKLKEKYSE